MNFDRPRLTWGANLSVPAEAYSAPNSLGVSNGRLGVFDGTKLTPIPAGLGVGPSSLSGGTMAAGFFGMVPNSDLIDGAGLSDLVGMHNGALKGGDTNWLKFAHDNKVLFYSSKIVRASDSGNNIMWGTLTNRHLVFGDTTVTIGDADYVLRILTDVEWEDLMYPITVGSPTPAEDRWASFYPQDIDVGDNYYSTSLDLATNSYVNLGTPNITGRNTYGYLRWRPVLELVQ